MNHLNKYKISEEDIKRIQNFIPRDELFTIHKNEFYELVNAFSQYAVIDQSIPLFTDNESNFICMYTQGVLKGKIFCNQHDDTMLAPLFHDLGSFLDFLDEKPEFTQCYQFSNYWKHISYWDYPSKNEQYKNENLEIISQLRKELEISDDYFAQDNLAFSIIAMTPDDSIEEIIYPLLNHEDFYIPEFAANMLGYLQYTQAIPILEEVQEQAKSNAKTAINNALSRLIDFKKREQ